jgi:hypothetical protein
MELIRAWPYVGTGELLGKFRSVQRQLWPATDKPSHILLPALCHNRTNAPQQKWSSLDHLVG